MKIEKTVCPYCGAPLTIDPAFRQATCEYCGMTSLLRTEAKPAPSVDAEEQGYRFEKGRQRAQAEMPKTQPAPRPQQTVVHVVREQPRKRHTFWWIMGWIFIFPVPASILISRKKMPWLIKGFLYLVVWGLYFLLIMSQSGS